MWMAILGTADEPLFDCGGATGIAEDGGAIDARPFQFRADDIAIAVCPNNCREGHVGFEAADHVGDVGGTAQADFVVIGPQQNDGRFLADALGVAENIAIQNRVADDEDAGMAQMLYEFDESRHDSRNPLRANGLGHQLESGPS